MVAAGAKCVQFLGGMITMGAEAYDNHLRSREYSKQPPNPEFLSNVDFTKGYVEALQDLDEAHEFQAVTVRTLQQTACAIEKIEYQLRKTRTSQKADEDAWCTAEASAVDFTRKLREMLNQAVSMESLRVLVKPTMQQAQVEGPSASE